MASATVNGVRIAGLACAVPAKTRETEDDYSTFGEAETLKIRQTIGVRKQHVSPAGVCTSDLCEAAAKRLITDLKWELSSIDALVFISQTPDYILPATSCSLHGRLGLGKHCIAFDVNLGCSGYVYGLWLVSQLFANTNVNRAILMAGDTISRIVSPLDRATAPLFGDAGTVTALERADGGGNFLFELGTDGTGDKNIMVPAGMFRKPRTEQTSIKVADEGGNRRSEEDLFMDGAEVFAFTLREVQPLVNSLLKRAEWSVDSVDAFVMHQANQFMLQHIAKRLKIPSSKFVLAMEEFGNTSSASIPLAINSALAETLRVRSQKLVLVGFGVGFSWAAGAIECGPMVIPPIVELG